MHPVERETEAMATQVPEAEREGSLLGAAIVIAIGGVAGGALLAWAIVAGVRLLARL